MDYCFSEKQEMMRTSAREFLTRECPLRLVRQIESGESGFPAALWNKIAELGWLGLIIPECYGGSSGTMLDMIVILEEAGRVLLPVPLIPNTMGALAVVWGGSQYLRSEMLPRLARGEAVATIAINELQVVGKAGTVVLSDGHGFRIRGTKVLVPYADVARYIVVNAEQHDAEDGVDLLVVDASTGGVRCSPLKTISGTRLYEVSFDDAYVPADNVLQKAGDGALRAKFARYGAVAECAWMLGAARRVFEMAVEYVKVREQYGRPIAAFQSVQHQCADMAVDLRAAEYLTYQAAWKLTKQTESFKEVSIAKVWVNEACRRVASRACYLHGALGYSEECDVQLYLRRIIGAIPSFGDTSGHLRMVAQELLG